MSPYGLGGGGRVVEQDVSVRLQVVSMLSLGAGSSGSCALVRPCFTGSGASVPSGRFWQFSSPEDKSSSNNEGQSCLGVQPALGQRAQESGFCPIKETRVPSSRNT